MKELQKMNNQFVKDKLVLHIDQNLQLENARSLLNRAAEESFEGDATISTARILELNKLVNGFSNNMSQVQDELCLFETKR